MQCLNCGGQLEWAGGGQHARCMRCLSLFNQQNGQLTPVVVQAPGGGFNPEFNAIFAQNLGFGPPPPGAQPMPPPQMGMGQAPQPQHNVGAGTFDLGGGQQLRVKINGMSPEGYVKNQVSSMIWGWIIGGIILVLILLTFAGIGIYVYAASPSGTAGVGGAGGGVANVSWDGKSTLECKGNDKISLTGVTASAGIKASANCELKLVGVNITAPVGIEATGNAKVSMTGGSITSTTNSVVAANAAKVTLVGTKLTGKTKASNAAKITGP